MRGRTQIAERRPGARGDNAQLDGGVPPPSRRRGQGDCYRYKSWKCTISAKRRMRRRRRRRAAAEEMAATEREAATAAQAAETKRCAPERTSCAPLEHRGVRAATAPGGSRRQSLGGRSGRQRQKRDAGAPTNDVRRCGRVSAARRRRPPRPGHRRGETSHLR